MSLPLAQALGEEGKISRQIDELHPRRIGHVDLAIAFLDSRARDYGGVAARERIVDVGTDRRQPRLAVAVGERNAMAHLLDVRARMKLVGVSEGPGELRGERKTHGGL